MCQLSFACSEFSKDLSDAHCLNSSSKESIKFRTSCGYFYHFLGKRLLVITTCLMLIISLPVQKIPVVYIIKQIHSYLHSTSNSDNLLNLSFTETFNRN